MIQRYLHKYSIFIDDFFLFFQVLFVNLSISAVLIKASQLASLFFYISIGISFAWFAYKIATFVISVFKRKMNNVFLISSLITFLLYFICVLITIIFACNNRQLDFLTCSTKTILYLTAINFIYCSINSKFNRIIFFETIFLADLFLLMSILLFILGPARVWGSYGKWQNLTLNFANPNLAGLIIFVQSLLVLVGIYSLKSKFLKILFIVSLFGSFALLLLTSSRTFFIALVFAFVFSVLRKFINDKKTFSLLVCLVPLVFPLIYIFASYLIQLNSGENLQIAVYTSANGKSLGTRITIWLWPLKIISQKPFFGSFIDSYNGHYHNTIIDAWITFGGIFMILFIALISISLFLVSKNNSSRTRSFLFFCFTAALMTMISETTILYSSLGTCCLYLIYIPFSTMDLESAYEKYSKVSKRCDVLLLTNVFGVGSIGKMTKTIYENIKQTNLEACVLYGRGQLLSDSNKVIKCCDELEAGFSKFLSRLFKNIYSFNIISTLNVIDFIKKAKVKVVNIHAINDFYINPYILFRFLKKQKIKVLYTAHSGNLAFANCGGNSFDCGKWKQNPGCINCPHRPNPFSSLYWKRMNKIMSGFGGIQIVAVSNYLKNMLRESPYLKNKTISVIGNCVDNDFVPCTNQVDLPGFVSHTKNLLLVIPNTKNTNKGFDFFKTLSERMPDLNFICIAYNNRFSRINNLSLIPAIDDKKVLAQYYSKSDITLVLSKSETYCLPVSESLSCGTPVVGFKSGGPEEIAIKEFSSFVEYGNIDALIKEINVMLNRKVDKKAVSTIAKDCYSMSSMLENYLTLYRKCIAESQLSRMVEIYI